MMDRYRYYGGTPNEREPTGLKCGVGIGIKDICLNFGIRWKVTRKWIKSGCNILEVETRLVCFRLMIGLLS